MSNIEPDQNSLGESLKDVFTTSNSDKDYNAVKAIVNSIPAIGSLAANFYETYITPPITKRLYTFLDNLVKELNELKSRTHSVDFNNPVFVTNFIQACRIAAQNHKEQKLEILRNAVLNSSIPSSLDDDILSIFLKWIDELTVTHISTLKCFHYLEQYTPEQIKAAFPELDKNRDIYNLVIQDLATKGLLNLRERYITEEETEDETSHFLNTFELPPPYNRERGKGKNMRTIKRTENIDTFLENSSYTTRKSTTTELGRQFIEFIEKPKTFCSK